MNREVAPSPRAEVREITPRTRLTVDAPSARGASRAVLAWLALGALAGVALLVYTTAPWGPGVNETALHNFAAAEGLRAGTTMTLSRGEPYVLWPPLAPVLFALGRSLGLAYPTVGLTINLAAYGATLFLGALLLLRLFHSPALAVASQVMLLASPELLRSASTLQTEPLFYALVLACLCAFASYLEQPTRGRFAAVAALALLACLQRYVGVALVAGVGLLMLFHPVALPRRVRWIRAAAFGVISVGPLALWLIRNARLGETQIDDPAQRGILPNASATLATLVRFITLDALPRGPAIVFAGISAIVALVLVAFVISRWARDRTGRERLATSVYASFPLAYAAVIIVSASRVNIDPIHNRYVMPMYPFVWGILLLGFAELAARLRGVRGWTSNALRVAVAAWFAAHLALAVHGMHAFVARAREEGVGGFSTRAWQRSPLVEWLRAHPSDAEMYSNVPEIVLFAIGRRAVFVEADSISRILDRAPSGALVVWVTQLPRAVPLPDAVVDAPRLHSVAQLADGAVYRVDP
jgi:4-amino-4-deoxy-L-arabinose transferase-like glycosyltransferase